MPALTSPWKVGFLVALLLVVTAIGVTYFISGTFGVTWHWIKMSGTSPSSWSFNLGAFIDEMVPLLVLTSLLAFAAYGLVAGAVRRYKTYVDSGSEYKQLLKSIKSVDDLEDEELFDALKQHPALREFMISVKNRVAAVERQHEESGRRRADAGAGSRGPDQQTLASECAILASAAMNGKGGFANDLALTTPELRQVEQAVRKCLADLPAAPAPAATGPAPGELEAMRAGVRGAVSCVRRDADACVAGARELEVALAAMRQRMEGLAPSPPAGDSLVAVTKHVDAAAGALAALGEETRRIAIAAALQASGGADGDSIRVADEVRTVATKFNAVAQQWKQVSALMRSALAPSASASRPGDQDRAALISAVGVASNKASLWAERAVALVEQVRGVERAAGIDGSADSRPAEAPAESAARWDAADEEIDVPSIAPVFSTEPAAGASDENDIANAGAASEFDAAAVDEAPFADIPGFEKERRFFVEADGSAEAKAAAGDVAHLEVEAGEREDWSLDAGVHDLADAPEASAPAPGTDGDGFLTGPRPAQAEPLRNEDRYDAKAAQRQRSTAADPKPLRTEAAATAMLEPTADVDADAIDLYALGAVDYVDA
jgi:hypothetical protein